MVLHATIKGSEAEPGAAATVGVVKLSGDEAQARESRRKSVQLTRGAEHGPAPRRSHI